jgi:hypothetical protein
VESNSEVSLENRQWHARFMIDVSYLAFASPLPASCPVEAGIASV